MLNFVNKLFSTTEGRVLLFGVFLIGILSLFLFLYSFYDNEFTNHISAMVITNIAVGRVPSLSFGYASELSHFTVIATNVYVEMILVCVIYPLFVFSFKDIIRVKFLEKLFHNAKKYQKKHQELFDKYGILGLFIFVFIPFWMTGPIVGSIIGYLIGISHLRVLGIVFIATSIAISIWGFLLKELVVVLNMIDSSLVWFVLAAVILGGLFMRFKKR